MHPLASPGASLPAHSPQVDAKRGEPPQLTSDLTGTLGGAGWERSLVAEAFLPAPARSFSGRPLGLEQGQAAPQALPQELHVGGRGRVFEGGGEAEGAVLHVLGLHGGDVQEVVGVDVVDLGERLGEGRATRAQSPLLRLLGRSWEKWPLPGLPGLTEADGSQAEPDPAGCLPLRLCSPRAL